MSLACPLLSPAAVQAIMQDLNHRASSVTTIASQRLARLALATGHHQLVYDIQDLEDWVQVA